MGDALDLKGMGSGDCLLLWFCDPDAAPSLCWLVAISRMVTADNACANMTIFDFSSHSLTLDKNGIPMVGKFNLQKQDFSPSFFAH
jgi:hypothetical protein